MSEPISTIYYNVRIVKREKRILRVNHAANLQVGGGTMCLILFAYDCHPRYKLVAAANRDEFYQRPALPASFWPDHPAILAGKDLKEGGTWTGITTSGRWAALTNYRDPASFRPEAPSRGHLVHSYLSGHLAPPAYIESLGHGGAEYNGFNLLLGTRTALYYYSNRERLFREVEKGVHGLSNSLLDVPWPKVTKGTNALADGLQHQDVSVEYLFTMMADREQPADRELPETGVGLQKERMLAPAFVLSPDYGTIILIDRTYRVQFRERSFKPASTTPDNEVYYEFTPE